MYIYNLGFFCFEQTIPQVVGKWLDPFLQRSFSLRRRPLCSPALSMMSVTRQVETVFLFVSSLLLTSSLTTKLFMCISYKKKTPVKIVISHSEHMKAARMALIVRRSPDTDVPNIMAKFHQAGLPMLFSANFYVSNIWMPLQHIA